MSQKENRIQVYLKPLHRQIIDGVREEKHWDDSVSDREIILYMMMEYDRLKQKEKKAEQKLKYIDQHTTMVLDLVASICSEMNVPQRPLEDCLSYFEAKEYMESLMNNRRTIRPSQAVQRILQTPKAMRKANKIASQMYREAISQENNSQSLTEMEQEKRPLGSALGDLLDKHKKSSLTITDLEEEDFYRNNLD